MRSKDQARKVYVHMLNGTLCATERTMCCIVENYQTPEVRLFGVLSLTRLLHTYRVWWSLKCFDRTCKVETFYHG